MNISENIKTIDNKNEQNKVQYNLDRQIAKSSPLSSGNVIKYEFLTSKDVLPEKDLLEKAAIIKRFEYSPLGKELKKQTSIAEKRHQKLHNNYEFLRIKKEKPTIKKYNRSNIIYSSKFSFHEYNTTNFNSISLKLKFKVLPSFYNEFYRLVTKKESTKEKKQIVFDNAPQMYNEYRKTYFNQYMALSDHKKLNWVINMIPLIYFLLMNIIMMGDLKMKNPLIEKNNLLTKKEESVDLSDMTPLECDEEEVKEGKGLTILTPNKLLTRFPMLLARIKLEIIQTN